MKLRHLAAVMAVLALAILPVHAANLYWDGGTADILTNGNGASAGGGGTWNTTTLNWDAGAAPHAAWNNTANAGDTAVFAGSVGTVTLGTGITVGGLTLGTANYLITGFTALPGVTNISGTRSVTWTKAAGYTGSYGTDFVVETSETLTGTWTAEASPGTVTITGNQVKFTFPSPLGAKKFARLKVVITQ